MERIASAEADEYLNRISHLHRYDMSWGQCVAEPCLSQKKVCRTALLRDQSPMTTPAMFHKPHSKIKLLTILIIRVPRSHPLKSCRVPELLGARRGVLEALLDFDALEGFDALAEDGYIAKRGDEGLVTAAVFVVDILADDFPGFGVKDFLVEDFVGVGEAIQDESFDGVSVIANEQ